MRTGAMQGSWNSGNGAATVDIRKRLRAVRDPGPNPARSRDDLTSITGVFIDLLAGIHGRPLGRSPNGCASRQAAQGQSLRRLTARRWARSPSKSAAIVVFMRVHKRFVSLRKAAQGTSAAPTRAVGECRKWVATTLRRLDD